MKYHQTITLKNGMECTLRNGEEKDGPGVLGVFQLTHGETDYLLTYPEETTFDARQEGQFLKEKTESNREIEIVAEINGAIVGTGGIQGVGTVYKLRHRAEFGIGIAREYWGLGIGKALTEACIACARKAGYTQLELDVVGENQAAIALYRKMGFQEYGRNPKGFRSRLTGDQELVYMRLEL